jgi:hypothetical protein
MGTPKQIVFRYNGDPATEEHVADLEGEETIPARGIHLFKSGQGAVVERKGKHWKVVAVNKEETVTTPKAISVYRVYLSDRSGVIP